MENLSNVSLEGYTQEAVDLVREFRHQAVNTIFAEFQGDDLVEVPDDAFVDALAFAYLEAGENELIFKKGDFDKILAALEILEPDPNSYECEEYTVYLRYWINLLLFLKNIIK